RLTMGVYTDPKLLDVRGALEALPVLSLQGDQAGVETVRATGTEDKSARKFAPGFVPNPCNLVQTETTADKSTGEKGLSEQAPTIAVTSSGGKRKGRLSSADNRPSMSGRLDSNQRPPEPHSGALAKLRHAPIVSPAPEALTSPWGSLAARGCCKGS